VVVLVLRGAGSPDCLVCNLVLLGCLSFLSLGDIALPSALWESHPLEKGQRRRQGTFSKHAKMHVSHQKSNDLSVCYLFPWSPLDLRMGNCPPYMRNHGVSPY
jgi:hypothetical protein